MEVISPLAVIGSGVWANRGTPVHTFDDSHAGRISTIGAWNDGRIAFKVDVESTAAILPVAIGGTLRSIVGIQAIVAKIAHRALSIGIEVREHVEPAIRGWCT